MKKKLLTLFFASGLLLSACGDDSDVVEGESTIDDDVEEVEDEVEETEEVEEVEEDSNSELYEYNEEIINDDNVAATLIEIEKTYDEDRGGEKVEVRFEVENKRDDLIVVQARSVSMNDKMVDSLLLTMSQEVAAGKSADAVLKIENYDGEVPELEDNLEMELHIYSRDDREYRVDPEVRAEFD